MTPFMRRRNGEEHHLLTGVFSWFGITGIRWGRGREVLRNENNRTDT